MSPVDGTLALEVRPFVLQVDAGGMSFSRLCPPHGRHLLLGATNGQVHADQVRRLAGFCCPAQAAGILETDGPRSWPLVALGGK